MKINYRREIDGLRAIAIVPVFIYHAFPNLIPGGFVGVDIFFVISGYLISLAIFQGIDNNSFSFRDFYARRTRRIFPALVLMLMAVYAAGYFMLLPSELTRLGKNIAAAATFTLNFLLQYDVGYFDASGDRNPILNLWSLCIEEQFYLLFPPIFIVAAKFGLNRLFVILLIILASFSLNVLMIGDQATATFFSPLTRFWEMAVGSLLAHFLPNQKFLEKKTHSLVLSTAGLVLILLSIFLIDKNMAFPGWLAIIPAIGAFCILAAEGENQTSDLISNKFLVWIGRVSYPLYLWHYPIFAYLRIYEAGEPSVLVMLVGMIISVTLAYLTYAYIEHPIRFGRFKQTRGILVVLPLVVGLLSVGVVGKLTQGKRGFPQRINSQEVAPASEMTSEHQCRAVGLPPDASCIISNPDHHPNVALIGDSHASHFAAGLQDHTMSHGQNLVVLSGPGCVPFLDVRTRNVKGDPQTCGEIVSWIYSYINENPQINTIYIATRGPISLNGKTYGEEEVAGRYIDSDNYPAAKTQKELFVQSLDRTLARLLNDGKKVFIILDNPELGFNPQLCSDLPLIRQTKLTCAIPRAEVDARNADYREIMREAQSKYPNINLIDTFKVFCDDSLCYARKNDRMLYRDNNHLTVFGSKELAPLYKF